jgi:hypothetical protein
MLKLLSVICINFLQFLAIPYYLLSELDGRSIMVLIVAAIVVGCKTIFGDIASGGVEYHKQGYDFCVMTLGASMTSLSYKMAGGEDHLSYQYLPWLESLVGRLNNSEETRGDFIVLVSICLFSLFLTLLTARISKAVRENETKLSNTLQLLNFILGSGLLGFYILLLLTK